MSRTVIVTDSQLAKQLFTASPDDVGNIQPNLSRILGPGSVFALDRGGLVGAFIVEEDDEVLSITSGGQVVRSPIDENFRPTGRSTMGVKFVTPKSGDTVAVVARSVEAKVVDEAGDASAEAPAEESPAVDGGATIEGQDAVEMPVDDPAADADGPDDNGPDENTEE